jgi:hydroxymethylbilane synthase
MVPGPGARPRTTAAAVSSQLVSSPSTVKSSNGLQSLSQDSKAPSVNPQSPQSPLRLGTRGSKLALIQAELVRAALAGRGVACDIVPVRTTGDRITDRPLAEVGGKGLFTKELEDALLADRIDLAVHSMKDVPVVLPAGLTIAALLPREDPRDAFISNAAGGLRDLPKGARVGTSSVRRHAQVRRARADVEVLPLRGNVDTRLEKLARGEFDAILLAVAGLKRLGLERRATGLLSPEEWLPALSQGAIGIEVRSADRNVHDLVALLNDQQTDFALACERAFQAALDGSCTTAIGGIAMYEDGVLRFRGEVLAPDGSSQVDIAVEQSVASAEDAASVGRAAGLSIRPRAAQWLPG